MPENLSSSSPLSPWTIKETPARSYSGFDPIGALIADRSGLAVDPAADRVLVSFGGPFPPEAVSPALSKAIAGFKDSDAYHSVDNLRQRLADIAAESKAIAGKIEAAD